MSARSAIGAMRRRIVIERPTGVADGAGGSNVAWSQVATVWARIMTAAAVEDLERDVVGADLAVAMTIRYRPGLNAGMRVVDGPRVFEIQSVVDPDDRRTQLRISAIERRQ